jgi:RNA polymerase sigma factor (sigma-70 family)
LFSPNKRIAERALQRIFNFFAACFSSAISIQTPKVKALAGNGFRQTDFFPLTHWSAIIAAGRSQAEPEIAKAALAELCQTYWSPLYSFVRSRGHTLHDAQDLTQSFFAFLIEHKIYRCADPQKGRFRAFLLASIKNFLANASDHDRTLKCGGQNLLPLREEQIENAESLFQTYCGPTNDDQVFDRSWAESLVAAGLERLSEEYKRGSKEKLFNELRIFLTSGAQPLPSYAELAVQLGIGKSTLRSHVTRLRARYREALRAEVRRTVDTEAEVDEELRELLRVLTRD